MASIDPERLLLTQPTEQELAMFKFYKKNPDLACIDLLKQDLAPFQRIVVNGVQNHSYSISVLARGSGKTRMIAMNAAYMAMFNPKMRVGFFAPGFRQCPEIATTYSFTDQGMLRADELSSLPSIYSLYKKNKVLGFVKNETADGFEIKTEKGYYIAGKSDHKVLVYDQKDCTMFYKTLKDISSSDYVVIKKGYNYWNEDLQGFHSEINSFIKKRKQSVKEKTRLSLSSFSGDTAYAIGSLIGDGFISTKNRKYRVGFSSCDKYSVDKVQKGLADVCHGVEFKKTKEYNYELYSKPLVELLEYIGVPSNSITQKKVIPQLIRKAPKQYVTEFLKGLYDTDGCVSRNGKLCDIKLTTASFDLAQQVHTLLLNYGIISSMYGVDPKGEVEIMGVKTTDNGHYNIRILDKDNIRKFKEEIGFSLPRKRAKLEEFVKIETSDKDCSSPIPGVTDVLKTIVQDNNFSKLNNSMRWSNKRSGSSLQTAMRAVETLEKDYCIQDDRLSRIRQFNDLGLTFLKVVEKRTKEVETIDIEVENEKCYNSNGFISHNSKLAFMEFMTILDESPYLDASVKRISKQTDMWSAEFHNGSFIFALPLAADNAASIRGTRVHCALLDEYPHIPKEVIDLVINPMLATQRNPMMNVRRIQKEKKLIAAGELVKATESEQNKICGFSSAYFQFNHMYKTICNYRELGAKQLKKGRKSDYAVYVFNYKDAPEGFFDDKMIEYAKATSSDIAFRMEYMSEFPADSDGFFKRSLIDACVEEYSIEMRGEKGFRYFMGLDPARNEDNFAISILKLDGETMKLVRVITFHETPFPEVAQFVRKLTHDYSFEMIGIDAGGGGLAIKDLLGNPASANGVDEIFLDMDDDENVAKKGRKIIKMVNFSSKWIAESNHDMKASMEHQKLRFPSLRESNTFIKPEADSSDLEDQAIVNYYKLIDELQSIVITATKNGTLHFDTPNPHMKKDRYSSLLIAHKIAYDYIVGNYQPKQLAMGGWLGPGGQIIDADDDREYVWQETRIIDDVSRAKQNRRSLGDGALAD